MIREGGEWSNRCSNLDSKHKIVAQISARLNLFSDSDYLDAASAVGLFGSEEILSTHTMLH